MLPFGCGVWFLPTNTRPGKHGALGHAMPKWGGRGCLGIFAGYEMSPSCEWSGRYLVWPIDTLATMNLSSDASGRSADARKLRDPHRTMRVDVGTKGIRFPLKEIYDWWNESGSGRLASRGMPGPNSSRPTVDRLMATRSGRRCHERTLSETRKRPRAKAWTGLEGGISRIPTPESLEQIPFPRNR